MKTVYIPKGETVNYESLETEHLVVDGCLKAAYAIHAKDISGSGMIFAGKISADSICADELEAASIICKRLIAKRVETPELFATESAAVTNFLSVAYVETEKLTVAGSDVSNVKAAEVIHLKEKKRSLFGTLLASLLRSFWTMLTAPDDPAAEEESEVAMDADYEPVEDEAEQQMKTYIAEEVQRILHQRENDTQDEDDFELRRVVTSFQFLREHGYTLKVLPGTPEENAPVFHYEPETAMHPAA